ncbi:MAG: pitrilysin family protein [Myxococcota bacterium]
MNIPFRCAPILCGLMLTGCFSSSGTGQDAKPAEATPQDSSNAGTLNDFRATPPTPGPMPEFLPPEAIRKVMDNGLTVLSVQKSELPLVHFHMVLRSGTAMDPEKSEGLAGFLSEMIRAGTKTRSAADIDDAIETLGSALHITADQDSMVISFTALKENFAPVLDVVTDIIQNPAFANKELKRVRGRRLGSLAQVREDPTSMAWRVFRRSVYGNHAYGHSDLGTEETIEHAKPSDFIAFYKKHFRPGNAAVIITGDMSADDTFAAVDKRLASWRGKGGSPEAPSAPTAQAASGVILVDKPEAPQSQLRIGHLAVSRDDPDYFPIVLCNAILGGMFNSRINMNLREDKGFTYGARSSFDFLRGQGSFVVSTGVRTDVTTPAIQEVLHELDQIRSQDVTQGELDRAKQWYSRSLPGFFQTIDGIAGMIANIYLFDLPLDYYRTLPDKIAAVTIEDVRRVAQAHIKPSELAIVVVGDRKQVEPTLAELKRGPIQIRNADGELITKPNG